MILAFVTILSLLVLVNVTLFPKTKGVMRPIKVPVKK